MHAGLGIYGSGAKLQDGGFRVTPLNPRGKAWKMVTTSLEEGCAIDSVERVFEVNLKEHLILVPHVALEPLARNPNAYFSSQGLGHPYLQWEKKSGCLLLESFAKAFATVFLGQGGQRSPSQERGDTGWGAPRGEKANKGGNVFKDFVPHRATQSLFEVQWLQDPRAAAR